VTRRRSWIISDRQHTRLAIVRAATRETAAAIHAARSGHDPPVQLSERWYELDGQPFHVSGPHPDTRGKTYQPLDD
jgi:hypothetical protein